MARSRYRPERGNASAAEATSKVDASMLLKYIHDWIHVHLLKHKSGSTHTWMSYRMAVRQFMEYLATLGVTATTISTEHFAPKVLTDWMRWLKEVRGNCGATINARLAAIRSMLHYLATQDVSLAILRVNAGLVEPMPEERKGKVWLTRDAVSALLSVPDPGTRTGLRDRTLMLLLYGLALRIDEALSLTVGQMHVDDRSRSINIIGKGGRMRPLYTPPAVVEDLERYIREFHGPSPKGGDYLFYSPWRGTKGKLSQEAVRKRLLLIAKEAHEICPDVPLGLSAHAFRRSRAQHWREDGINLVEIQALLGHSDITTTMIYLDVSEQEKRNALEKMAVDMGGDVEKAWDTKTVSDLLAALDLE